MIEREHLDELPEILENYSVQLSFEELLNELSDESEIYDEIVGKNVWNNTLLD